MAEIVALNQPGDKLHPRRVYLYSFWQIAENVRLPLGKLDRAAHISYMTAPEGVKHPENDEFVLVRLSVLHQQPQCLWKDKSNEQLIEILRLRQRLRELETATGESGGEGHGGGDYRIVIARRT